MTDRITPNNLANSINNLIKMIKDFASNSEYKDFGYDMMEVLNKHFPPICFLQKEDGTREYFDENVKKYMEKLEEKE